MPAYGCNARRIGFLRPTTGGCGSHRQATPFHQSLRLGRRHLKGLIGTSYYRSVGQRWEGQGRYNEKRANSGEGPKDVLQM